MQDDSRAGRRESGASVQVAESGDNTRVEREDVRRVVGQIVEAASNSFARVAANMCREKMVDESPGRIMRDGASNASYIAGRNDVLRELAKWFDGRIERALVEAVARDAVSLVEVVPDEDKHVEVVPDEDKHGLDSRLLRIGCPMPCPHCARCCCVLTERRVYFGVAGPFCAVACREAWLERDRVSHR